MTLAELVPVALQISIFALLFALGLATGPRGALTAIHEPRRLLIGAFAMFVVMPLVAVALALMFALEPAVEMALVAIALSPVPPFLPSKQTKAGGDPSRIIGLFVAASVLAIFVIPVGADWIASAFGLASDVGVAQFARIVGMTVLLPLGAGMLVHHLWGPLASRTGPLLAKAATLLLLLAVLPILFRSFPAMIELIGNGTLLALVAFVAIGLAVGHVCGVGHGEERTVLALATASRHPGVAMAIAAATAPGVPYVGAAVLLYLIVGAVLSAIYLGWIRRQAAANA